MYQPKTNMQSQTIKTITKIDILTKFGLAWTLLPYYGEWKQWHLVLNLAWRKSRAVWIQNINGFRGLVQMVDWRTNQFEIEAIFKNKFNTTLDMNERANLMLSLDDNNDVSFISAVKGMRFPRLNRLELMRVECLHPIYIKQLNKFLKSSFSHKLNELVLSSHSHIDLDAVSQSIGSIMKNSVRSVKFDRVYISKTTLKVVLNSLEEVKTLRLVSWQIDVPVDLDIEPNSLKVS